jgi:cyclophilin family peptidyl-prolyl cis-trans isomerase/HEAT repeat protein
MRSILKTNRFVNSGYIRALAVFVLVITSLASANPQPRTRQLQNPTSGDPVSKILLLRIMRAENERRWDDDLRGLFSARNGAVRSRAALAAGRIGNEAAIPDLVQLLQKDDEPQVRAMAAFALGEIESPLAADALVEVVKNRRDGSAGARAVEALGKIVAALPKEQAARAHELGAVILDALTFEARRRSAPDTLTILLGLTATLRAKSENAGPIVAEFLHYSDPRIRGDAANALARLKLKDGNDKLRQLLVRDPDPVVQGNAARVLGVTEDKDSFELLERALNDKDSRVRVSAIRALGSLKDARATNPLLQRGQALKSAATKTTSQANELLEIATVLGTLRKDANDERVVDWLRTIRPLTGSAAPEVEIALARIYPSLYLSQLGTGAAARRAVQEAILTNWRAASSVAQGLGEIAAIPDSTRENKITRAQAEELLQAMLNYRESGIVIQTFVAVHSEYAIPDVLQAYAAFKPKDLDGVLRKHLNEADVVVRGTAADLLGELPPEETNARALIAALPAALTDKQLNDAALSVLGALAKQKNSKANEAIKTALDCPDYLVRRRAVALLKANDAGDFASRIGTVQTRNTAADYERAMARIGKWVTAVVTTNRGSFTIDFLPEEAPLTVDNFIQLANRKYFNGFTIHRVVPNFVMQDGDPRGDGNGGPGYQIRCEINEVPYARGAVGMALSGKDTGGSQWFVTHAPQPHLDGGYTVFGNVIVGMDVVDALARGDVIHSIVIKEYTQIPVKERRFKVQRG